MPLDCRVQHAVGYVAGDEYYGAKASINVWAPKVSTPSEFSLSQIWVIAGSFGNDLNTIEAGWQVSLLLFFLPFFLSTASDDKKKRKLIALLTLLI
jgi:hypothetical protein